MIVAAGLLGGKAANGSCDDAGAFRMRFAGEEAEALSADASQIRGKGGTESRAGLFRSGTAFFVTRAGEMLTSGHVVRGCERIEVWLDDVSSVQASVESIDDKLDVALLATHHHVTRVAVFGAEPVRNDSSVFTIGFGLTPSSPLVPVITRGRVDSTARANRRRFLVVQAMLHQGNSGGPVIDERGRLVGMVVGRYVDRPDLGVVVRAGELARFIGATRSISRNSTGHSAQGDAEKHLREISVLVQCVDAAVAKFSMRS
ncbi:S1 family peptidase [Burkholderia sp. MR1-5-21]